MKSLLSIVVALMLMLPMAASAQLTVSQGGTGLTSVTANNIPYGVTATLRLGSESAFTYNPTTNLFTTTYASTTGISGTNGDLSKLTVTYASSTGFTATNATLGTATGTTFYGFGLTDCDGAGNATTWDATTGKFACGTITGTGDGVSNWLYNGSRLSPSTTVGIGVFASSTIGGGTGATGLTVNGTATTTALVVPALTSALTLTGATGLFAEYAGSSCTNQFPRSVDALGAWTCATVANTDLANSTVSYGGVSLSLGGTDATPAFNLADATGLPISTGVSGLGSNVASLLATFSSANLATALTDETGTAGSAVFSTNPLLAGFRSNASSTVGDGTATGGLTVNGTATSTNLKVTALTASRLIATAADKLMTSVSNLASWIAGTSNEITVTDDGDGTVTLSLPATIDLGGKTSLEIPNGASPTVDATGEIALNTTTDALSIATSTTALELPLYPPLAFAYASSSWTGTTTDVGYVTLTDFDETILSGICYANGAGKIVVGDGTASSSITTLAAGTTTVAVNKSFNKNGRRVIFAIGTPTTLSKVQCKFERLYKR